MEHWRRALKWTFVGIFAAAVAGGVLGSATRGSLADAANEAQRHVTTTSSASASASARKGHGPAVSPKIAAEGTAALLRLSDLPSGWTSAGTPAAPTRVTPWSAKLALCVGV
ncbi:MAG: hypothetical protein WAL61_11995, partial [Acidimicrobiales bacterium]